MRQRDAETAQRLGPADWTMPMLLLANYNNNLNDVQKFDQIITQNPKTGTDLSARLLYYSLGQWDSPAPTWNRRLRSSRTHFPYILRAALSLREVRRGCGRARSARLCWNSPILRSCSADRGHVWRATPSPTSLIISTFTNWC
jgi:hypothetical protein